MEDIEDRLSASLALTRLSSEALLTHLHTCLTGLYHRVAVPDTPCYLDVLLASQDPYGAFTLDAGTLRQDSFQVRYSDECFVLSAAYIEQKFNSATITDDQTVMVRFELKHLGEFKYKTDNLDFLFGGEQRTN